MRLRFTRRATRQLDAVLSYIQGRSPNGAGHVMDRLEAVIILLRDHPQSGVLTSKRDIRRIVVSPYPYLILYRATDEEIIIHSVRHAARRPRE